MYYSGFLDTPFVYELRLTEFSLGLYLTPRSFPLGALEVRAMGAHAVLLVNNAFSEAVSSELSIREQKKALLRRR